MYPHGPGVRIHDLTKKIPYEDGTFDVVYHSHVLEHFPKQKAPRFLSDCYRVLKPGGVIRVAVPDLESIARLYLDALDKASQGIPGWADNYNWMLLELFDQTVRESSCGQLCRLLSAKAHPQLGFRAGAMGSAGGRTAASVQRRGQLQGESSRTAEKSLGISFPTPERCFAISWPEFSLVRMIGRLGRWRGSAMRARSICGCMTPIHWGNCCKPQVFQIPSGTALRRARFRSGIASIWTPSRMGPSISRIPFTWKAPSLKIAHISTSDVAGGASRSAYRLHEGLRQLGQDSNMYVLHKSSADPAVHQFVPSREKRTPAVS